MPTATCDKACGSIAIRTCTKCPVGTYNLAQINVADGADACNHAGKTAYLALAAPERFSSGLRAGMKVSMTYSAKAGPYKPGPPGPPPPPPTHPCSFYKSKPGCTAVRSRCCCC